MGQITSSVHSRPMWVGFGIPNTGRAHFETHAFQIRVGLLTEHGLLVAREGRDFKCVLTDLGSAGREFQGEANGNASLRARNHRALSGQESPRYNRQECPRYVAQAV